MGNGSRRRALRLAGPALALGLAGGCARYHARPLVPDRSLERFEARRLDAAELGTFLKARQAAAEWPPPRWDLTRLTLAAFFYNPELDVARAQWAVARGGVLTAGGRANPVVTGGTGYNATTNSEQVTPWIPEVAIELPLGIAGKRGIRIKQARQLSEAARLNLITAAWRVRSQVRQAFLELYVARQSDSLLTRQVAIQAEIVRLLETQAGVGEVSPFEVTQARVALADGRLAGLDAAQRRARARSALALAVGVPPAALDSVTWAFERLDSIPVPRPPVEIRRRALVSRSDVRASLAEYEAAQAALQLEIRKQYPDLSLGPGYQLDQTDSKWTLKLSFPLPFPNRNRGPIAEARARREEAAARFLSLQSRVLSELEGALASSQVALAQVDNAASLTAGLTNQERLARRSYAVGQISRLELLGVESELVRSALARLDAIAKAQGAVGQLEDAMQSPLDLEPWTLTAPARVAESDTTREER